jgi:hypothetical protein
MFGFTDKACRRNSPSGFGKAATIQSGVHSSEASRKS